MLEFMMTEVWARFLTIGTAFVLGGIVAMLRARFIDGPIFRIVDPRSTVTRFEMGSGKVLIGIGLILIISGIIIAIV